jgi:hypothetical protein
MAFTISAPALRKLILCGGIFLRLDIRPWVSVDTLRESLRNDVDWDVVALGEDNDQGSSHDSRRLFGPRHYVRHFGLCGRLGIYRTWIVAPRHSSDSKIVFIVHVDTIIYQIPFAQFSTHDEHKSLACEEQSVQGPFIQI